MGIEEYKITGFKKPVTALADTPQMGADELKAWFDSNSMDELKTSVNGIIDSVLADEAAIAGKVDKEAGKGLSTNDYTDAEKAKSHTHANASVLDATTAAYTAAEKTKLSGVAAGANNYVHPASHSADMISTTASKRFTSDAEMAQKADKSYVDGALYDKADGAAVYAALDTKADKTAVDAIAPKAHMHTNASVLDETTAAFTTEEHEIISALQNDLDVFYTDLNILQNDVMDEIAPKAHEHTNKEALDSVTTAPTSQNLINYISPTVDADLNETTNLDNLPNGLTVVRNADGPGIVGYFVLTSLENDLFGQQLKLGYQGMMYRYKNYGEWSGWNPATP